MVGAGMVFLRDEARGVGRISGDAEAFPDCR